MVEVRSRKRKILPGFIHSAMFCGMPWQNPRCNQHRRFLWPQSWALMIQFCSKSSFKSKFIPQSSPVLQSCVPSLPKDPQDVDSWQAQIHTPAKKPEFVILIKKLLVIPFQHRELSPRCAGFSLEPLPSCSHGIPTPTSQIPWSLWCTGTSARCGTCCSCPGATEKETKI